MFDLKTCSKIIYDEMQTADKIEDEQEVCSLCGDDLYGYPLITPEGFKSHYTCYAIKLTKQQAIF